MNKSLFNEHLGYILTDMSAKDLMREIPDIVPIVNRHYQQDVLDSIVNSDLPVVKSEDPVQYGARPEVNVQLAENAVISQAITILDSRLKTPEHYITSPDSARQLAKLKLADQPAEIFLAMWFDHRHGLLNVSQLFQGTVNGASVYPREVVRDAMEWNAAAVVFVHNHPSGHPEPSTADKRITTRLKEALALIDVRVLDHLIVGHSEVLSFAEHGLL